MSNNDGYVYVMVRKDLTLAQQIVQACHAAYESGLNLGEMVNDDPNFLIVLQCKDEIELKAIRTYLIKQTKKISVVSFNEPDLNNELTAIATGKLYNDKERAIMAAFELWVP
jgi:hypothetical protein